MKRKIYDTIDYGKNTPPLVKWIRPGSRVLEFGTATGYITRYLKEQMNCRVVGIEINPNMAAAASVYAEQMIVADIDADPWLEQIEGKFDAVMFGDVLEHLRNPEVALLKSKSLLLPHGCILTSIPNIAHNAILMSLLDGEFNYTPYGLLDDTHIHFFTRKSIFEMAERVGLVCLDEDNCVERPAMTEVGKTYIGHFFRFLFLIGRKDGHVYQFRTRWGIREQVAGNPYASRPHRLTAMQMLLVWADDANLWMKKKFHFNFKLPAFLKKRVRG